MTSTTTLYIRSSKYHIKYVIYHCAVYNAKKKLQVHIVCSPHEFNNCLVVSVEFTSLAEKATGNNNEDKVINQCTQTNIMTTLLP